MAPGPVRARSRSTPRGGRSCLQLGSAILRDWASILHDRTCVARLRTSQVTTGALRGPVMSANEPCRWKRSRRRAPGKAMWKKQRRASGLGVTWIS